MSEDDLVQNLGTIARSGTKNFLSQLSGDQPRKDSNLIGQFGVGFYSVFMVADKVEVVTRKAGEELRPGSWTSDGKTGFEISPPSRDTSPAPPSLIHLNDEGKQYANGYRLQEIVKKYSNHIAFPIFLTYDKERVERRGKEVRQDPRHRAGQRRQRPLAPQQIRALRRRLQGALQVHLRRLRRPALLVPHPRRRFARIHHPLLHPAPRLPSTSTRPSTRSASSSTSSASSSWTTPSELLPQYLRFVRGIIDSPKTSRSTSAASSSSRTASSTASAPPASKRSSPSSRIAAKDQPEKYLKFIEQYNRPLKEGLYGDYANREPSSNSSASSPPRVEGLTSLADVKSPHEAEPEEPLLHHRRRRITPPHLAPARDLQKEGHRSPHPRRRHRRDRLLRHRQVRRNRAQSRQQSLHQRRPQGRLGRRLQRPTESAEALKPLLEKIKARPSATRSRTSAPRSASPDSPSCIVSDEDEPSLQMQQMLRAMGQKELPPVKPTLEINPRPRDRQKTPRPHRGHD